MMMSLSYLSELLWEKAHVLKYWFLVHSKCGIKMKWFSDLWPGTHGRPKRSSGKQAELDRGGRALQGRPRGRGKGTLESASDTPSHFLFLPLLLLVSLWPPCPICKTPPNSGGMGNEEKSSVLSHFGSFYWDCPERSPPWKALFMLSGWLWLLTTSRPLPEIKVSRIPQAGLVVLVLNSHSTCHTLHTRESEFFTVASLVCSRVLHIHLTDFRWIKERIFTHF